jgi:hypothetical protein
VPPFEFLPWRPLLDFCLQHVASFCPLQLATLAVVGCGRFVS